MSARTADPGGRFRAVGGCGTAMRLSKAPVFHALVLAGGAGSRFGGGKLRADWRGAPLIAGAMAAAFASPASAVTLVTGADAQVEAAARAAFARPFQAAHAADWAEGLAASLRAGWRAVPVEAQGVFVFLGDMPRTPPGVTAALVAALSEGVAAAAPVCGGRRGHPVLATRALDARVEALRGDLGLGAVLAELGDGLALVPTEDDGVLFDVDTRDAIGDPP